MKKEVILIKQLTDTDVKIELSRMLQELIAILNKYKIIYSVGYGTLLGAIRHKGFIPWDDDIDLIIERSEYQKLLEIIKSNVELKEKFIGFELGETDFPFIKFIDKNIVVNSKRLCDKNLWIDIFPLDYAPTDNKRFYRKQKIYLNLFWHYRASKNATLFKAKYKNRNPLKTFYHYLFCRIVGGMSQHTIIQNMIDFAKSFPKEQAVYLYDAFDGSFEKECFPMTKFSEFITVNFENIKVNAVKEFDYLLTVNYGDYMKIPDEQHQHTHELIVYKDI